MSQLASLELANLTLNLSKDERPVGTRFLAALVTLADDAVASLQATLDGSVSPRIAALGRLRGTGRGVSWSKLIGELERQYPLALISPFEGSRRVSGAAWIAADILDNSTSASVAKLQWEPGASDLPMHVHEHSDRFIVVHDGRGYFHVTDEPIDEFTGEHVRSIPARERDVFLLTRGVLHTFSTSDHSMTLLSCQMPFLSFDDPRQYRLPNVRWTAYEHRHDPNPRVACDPAWTLLIGGCFPPG